MTDQMQIRENETVEADQVFLLMTKDYRISRNIRASWFFTHLNSVLHYTPKNNLGDFTEELEIISITPSAPVKGKADQYSYFLTPKSIVTFLSHRYRLVICLDLSPSIVTGDVDSSHVLLDDVYHALSNSLRGVVRPFYIPDSKLLFSPQLFVTVIAHTPLITCKTSKVLLHGCLVTSHNVDSVLKHIHAQLEDFENTVADSFAEIVSVDNGTDSNGVMLTGGLFDDIVERPDSPKFESQIMTADVGFVSLLRYGILALQLLPADTSAGILVITDGIIGLPDINHFESLMTQLRNHTIACSFVQVGGGRKKYGGLGHVPYMELMQFIATATFGAFLMKTPKLDPDPLFAMNIYHRAFFTWNFQKGLDGFKIDNIRHQSFEQLDEDLAFLHRATSKSRNRQLWASPVMRKKHIEKNLHTAVSSLISVRLREGYTIKDVAITKGDSLIEVHMVLPWRDNVRIEYLAISPWPISQTKRHTRVEVTIEGSYDFLHDVTCPMKKPFKSPFRTDIVKKFWQTLQGLSETDQLMVHIQNFATNPVYYNIHESIKNGVPLFYLPPNSNNPVVSIKHSSKDNTLSQFATYWRPILLLDINVWQKWMHTHRIGLVLEHDTPLGKHLHIPNSSGRFHIILCRQALFSLNVLLRDWSSFVLMENHSYIKLIFQEPDKAPSSFYLLRVTSKPPCVALRLAFIGGTPGAERLQIVKDLREQILGLRFPQRGVPKEDSEKLPVRRPSQTSMEMVKTSKPPLQRSWSEIPCCVVMAKPVEQILIRYDCMPHDFMTLEPCFKDRDGPHGYAPISARRVAASMFSTLSCYLHHHRWVWSVQHGASMPLSMQALSRILSTLTKLRLQEGFHFASANSGIVSMVLEVDVKRPDTEDDISPCLIQYVLFPPHTTTTRESASEDELDMETAEADGELQLITECWIEPQHGVVVNSSPERKHFDRLSYKSLHKAIFPIDLECVSSMITFEHLNQMCQSITVPSPSTFRRVSPSSPVFTSDSAEQTIQHVPFAFDTVQLLPKCLQVEILLSTYIQDIRSGIQYRRGTLVNGGDPRRPSKSVPDMHTPCDILFSLILEQMVEIHDREVHLSDEECEKFLTLLGKRPRDLAKHPLPLKVPSSKEDEDAGNILTREVSFESTTTDQTWSRSEEVYMASCSSSLASILTKRTLSEEAYAQHAGYERQDTTVSESFSHCSSTIQLSENLRAATQQDDGNEPYEVIPRWRCFVKSLSSNHVMLTFAPASYEDLKLLVCDVESEKSHQDKSDDEPITFKVIQGQSSLDAAQNQAGNEAEDDADEFGGAGKIPDPSEDTRESAKDEQQEENNRKALAFPIYVYNCSLSNITEQLVNKWTYQSAEDIFQDLRFHSFVQQDNQYETVSQEKIEDDQKNKPLEDTGASTTQTISQTEDSGNLTPEVKSPREASSPSGGKEGRSFGGRGIERTESEGEREKWRRHCENVATDTVFFGQDDLKRHCSMITDSFFRSYVTGIYQSLKIGQTIEGQDVEAAVSNICEEAWPLEIDITHFMQTLCGHVNPLIERSNIQKMLHDDMAKTGPKLLEVVQLEGESSSEPTSAESCEVKPTFSAFLSSLQKLPFTSLMLPLATLRLVPHCESIGGLHDSIKSKFMKIINAFFLPVPSNPDFYFFYPQVLQRARISSRDFREEPEGNSKEQTGDITGGEESEIFMSDYENNCEPQNDQGNDLDMESLSSIIDDDLDSSGLDEMGEHTSPLFVHLTCSVRVSNNDMKSIGVHNLPICLAELQSCLEELIQADAVDLSTLHITLDIICYTLPSESEDAEGIRPKFDRMMSYQSQISHISENSELGDHEESTSFFTSEPGKDMVMDPLTTLPVPQQQAVKTCREQIQWLLRDEIACAMRNIFPVTMATLDTVAHHVQTSADRINCIVEQVPLQFVFGPDHSLARFVEEFERLDLPGYKLNKEGGYYYLVLDYNLASTLAHARAINSAIGSAFKLINNRANMEEMSPISNDRTLPNLNQDDAVFSGNPPEMISLIDSPQEKNQSHLGQEDLNTTDHISPMKEANTDNIKISVTRPSPVKERLVDAQSNHQDMSEKSPAEESSLSPTEESVSKLKTIPTDDQISNNQSGQAKTEISMSQSEDCQGQMKSGQGQVKLEQGQTEADQGTCEAGEDQGQIELGQEDILEPVASHEDKVIQLKKRHKSGESCINEAMARLEESRRTLEEGKPSSDGLKETTSEQLLISLNKLSAKPPSQLSPIAASLSDNDAPLREAASRDFTPLLRKTQSSASFEKFKMSHESLSRKVDYTSPSVTKVPVDQSGQGTPARHPSGPQTPVRSCHQSGPQTPQSCFYSTSSRSSYGEEGYDGDSSDSDSEGVMMSFNESQIQRAHLPDFWLIMRLSQDLVHVYFHTRDKGEGETDDIVTQKNIFRQVINHVTKTCRIVNQLLLLKDLNENRICNKLLVPEADEDINWKKDRGNTVNRRRPVNDSDTSESSDSESPKASYLAASMIFMPGHFACDCVWKIHFPLHPRLKTGPGGRTRISRGMQALRAVLNKFAVSDRKNMFVIKESSSNVFYLRLNESMCEVQMAMDSLSMTDQVSGKMEDEISLSGSLNISSGSLHKNRQDGDDDIFESNMQRRLSVGDRDLDTLSLLSKKRVEESIVLAAHGIGQVGPEISKDLVQLLQRRLDDAVLDILTVTLARNPMCKLTIEDVQFIQPPHEEPKEVVRLTIPASAMLQQFALVYYLRQNLQQFLHPPKYFDNKPENVFQDYTRSPAIAMAENDVFLYNRPQQSGGKGIACIYLTLVDGRGNPIHLISTHKPSQIAYKDTIDSSVFDAITTTTQYPVRTSSPKPGPACLVQFSIWEKGDVDIAQLKEKLQRSMRHAICDIIMEFRLLTAPLCETPRHYDHGIESPMHSAPPSPQIHCASDPKSALPIIPVKQTSDTSAYSPAVKTPKDKTALQNFVRDLSEAFSISKSSHGTPSNKETPKTPQTWQQVEGERRRQEDLKQKVLMYENGEKGVLQSTYSQTMHEWLEYCTAMGVPSVHKISGKLQSRFSVDSVLKEFQSKIGHVCNDVMPKVFKLMDGKGLWLPHLVTKQILTSEDGKPQVEMNHPHLPGRRALYCVIGRNLKHWRASIDYLDEEDSTADAPSLTNPKTQKSSQKFLPLEVTVAGEKVNDHSPGAFSLQLDQSNDRNFVPRQRLLFMTIRDTKYELYLYNWATDMANTLEKMFQKLIQWHNARSHLLSTIISQKMGLFRHTIFGELPADSISQETNPFIQSTADIDLLVKFNTPPREMQFRNRSGSILRSAPHIHPGVRTFETMFQNVKPKHPMQKCSYGNRRDPVQRHGSQMLEIKSVQRRENEKRMKLQELYMIWQQRMGHAPMSITEDVLDLLKRSSRLIHNVATPLLFSSHWRKKVLGSSESPLKQQDSVTSHTSDSKPRSRHSSGASVRSLRSDSIDSKKRASEAEAQEAAQKTQQEEAWHVDLRYSFAQQYLQYLQTQGFLEVRTRPSSLKRGSGKSSSSDGNTRPSSSNDPYKNKPQYMYLQKTLPGGIMLIEVGFREVYFCVRLFAFECSRVPVGSNVNSQLSLIFTDECDKFKDLTHAHSFAHDFHLRTIQAYITDGPLVFNKGYHLIGFLQDFIRHYPYAPTFSRNYIYQGNLTMKTPNANHQLYDYMLKHDRMYDMKAIRMKPPHNTFDLDMDNEYALVTQSLKKTGHLEESEGSRQDDESYDVGLVLCHDTSAYGLELNNTTLKLRYYVILTSRKKKFPKLTLEKKLRMFKTSSTKTYPAKVENLESSMLSTSVEDDPPPSVGHHLSARHESINYLGYSNVHQTPIYSLLMQEAEIARRKIEQMVESARVLCRRDTLWQRMLLGDQRLAEEESRGRKRRMTSDNEEKGSGIQRLSFTEFQDLLDIVTRVPLDVIDSQLTPLQTMSMAWYQTLLKVLTNKYTESHRFFSSNDGLVQYVVVLNPNYLDTFMMLGVDLLSNKSELCAVYREPSTADMGHTPTSPNLPAFAMQTCIEGFINTCCYHLWSGII